MSDTFPSERNGADAHSGRQRHERVEGFLPRCAGSDGLQGVRRYLLRSAIPGRLAAPGNGWWTDRGKPGVTFTPPADTSRVSHAITIRVPDCEEAYETLRSAGPRSSRLRMIGAQRCAASFASGRSSSGAERGPGHSCVTSDPPALTRLR